MVAWVLPTLAGRGGSSRDADLAEVAIYLIGSIAGGIAMGIVVEFPALALRDRFFPGSSPAAAPATLGLTAQPEGPTS